MFVKVHVIAESRQEALVSKDSILFVSVRERAMAGRANKRMAELLSAHFGGRRIRIVSGHHKPHKIVSVG